MKRAFVALALVAMLATTALADPACYPVRFGGQHPSFSWSETINLMAGKFPVSWDDPSQQSKQILFGRRQDPNHPRLVLHWPLDAPVNWPWTVVPVWCRDTGETAILAINTQTVETVVVKVYRLASTWRFTVLRAGPAGVTVHLADWATRGQVRRDETIRWPKRPVPVRSACLTHLLLRQRIAAEVLAIGRKIGAGSLTVAQATTAPASIVSRYEHSDLGRSYLWPDTLLVDEAHHVALVNFSALERPKNDPAPWVFPVGYDYKLRRLVAPPNYRDTLHQDYDE